LALDVRRASLEPEDMPLVELQLGRVFDRDDALAVRNRGRDGVKERRLSGTRTARDEAVQLCLNAAREEVDRLLGQRADVDHVLEGQAPLAELPDGEKRAGERE